MSDPIKDYFLRTEGRKYLSSLKQRKQNCDRAVKATQKVFNRLSELIDEDLARKLLLDYFTLKLIGHNPFILRIKPLVDWQLTGDSKIADLNTSEIDNLNYKFIPPLSLGWIYSKVMSPEVKEKNSAIYTPEEIVNYTVRSTFTWEFIATQTDDLNFLLKYKRKSQLLSEIDLNQIEDIEVLQRLHQRLGDIEVLDPCCGCGNYPYATLHRLAIMDDEAIARLQQLGVKATRVTNIHQLHGIEIDPIAHEICKRIIQMAWWECNYFSYGNYRLNALHTTFKFVLDYGGEHLPHIENKDILADPSAGKAWMS